MNTRFTQQGISSLSILIIVVLCCIIFWEISIFMERNSTVGKLPIVPPGPDKLNSGTNSANCIRTDPRDCNDTDDASDYQGN